MSDKQIIIPYDEYLELINRDDFTIAKQIISDLTNCVEELKGETVEVKTVTGDPMRPEEYVRYRTVIASIGTVIYGAERMMKND